MTLDELAVHVTMGLGFPVGTGIPWEFMGIKIRFQVGNGNGKEWE